MELGNIKLVYEHADFFIVHKPAGVGFHDESIGGQRHLGVFNQLQQAVAEDLFPVHRLDKLTSGLLIAARNSSAATYFQRAFERKEIEKLYLAVVSKKPKKKQGSVIGDMAKSRDGQWKLTSTKVNPAITRFFSFGSEQLLDSTRYVLLKPETGKTHQIRVALKSLGSPILGDDLYGGITSDRGYLHAFGLRFNYQGQTVEVYELPKSGRFFLNIPDELQQKFSSGFAMQWPRGK